MKTKYILLFICFVLIISGNIVHSEEIEPDSLYYGDEEAKIILNNIKFTDVSSAGSNYWARDAIYQMAALSVIKGFGYNIFGLNNDITKVEALALIYRAAGREEDAQKAAEIIEAQRNLGNRRTNIIAVWADGYLQLAAQDGLINNEQLEDAFVTEQDMLDPETDFIKTNPAQRQEVGVWIAKVFGIEPDYDQQAIFNSFKDWNNADPLSIPYLESVIKTNIMNGTPDGYFYPTKGIKREEMAQVLKNAEDYILQNKEYSKSSGYIQSISSNTVKKLDEIIETTFYDIINSTGQLDRIIVQNIYDINGNIIETSKQTIGPKQKELIVCGISSLGNSNLLNEGDRIIYYYDSNNVIKYVKQVSQKEEIVLRGEINTVDYTNKIIEFIDNNDKKFTYQVIPEPVVNINGKNSNFENLIEKSPAEVTIKNNLVVKIIVSQLESMYDEYEVAGIVEDINPNLGYISLYDEEGKQSFNLLRIYNFDNPHLVDVIREGKKATIFDVEQGDSVFLYLDTNKKVTKIAASENYKIIYGKVIKKNKSSVIIELDNGGLKQYDILNDTIILKSGKFASYSDVDNGQRVKLIIHDTDDFTKLKQLVVEKGKYKVEKIYKGNLYFYDIYNSTIVIDDVKIFDNSSWKRTENRGFFEIPVDKETLVYINKKKTGLDSINNYYVDNQVYVAVSKIPGGDKKGVVLSIKDENSEEKIFDDTIKSLYYGTNEFKTLDNDLIFEYYEGSIIVKNGYCIAGDNINVDDNANIVATRDFYTGDYYADIVQINDNVNNSSIVLYRGRIKSIDEDSKFVVESYSEFNNTEWQYYNTPKTFTINSDTLIIDKDGIVNNRQFNDYSDRNYINKVVNIIADGSNTVLISEAPYGEYVYTGTVKLNFGQTIEDTMELREVVYYNETIGEWEDAQNMTVLLRKDTIITKNGKLINPEDIEREDTVKIIKCTNKQGTTDEEVMYIEVLD